MSSDFLNALAELEREKGINKSILMTRLRTLSFRRIKNYGTAQDVRVEVDRTAACSGVCQRRWSRR